MRPVQGEMAELTQAERVQGIKRHIDDGLGGADLRQMITNFANYYGKDALLVVILEWLELDKRPEIERLAECAFGLVPGQVKYVYHVTHDSVRRVDGVVNGVVNEKTYMLETWVATARMAFDRELGLLLVRHDDDGLSAAGPVSADGERVKDG